MRQDREENGQKYQVRFLGELHPNTSKESAIVGVAKAYGVPAEEIASWFNANGVTLRESATTSEIKELTRFFDVHGLKLEITAIAAPEQPAMPEIDATSDVVSTSETARESDSNRDESPFDKIDNEGKAREITLEDLQQTLSQLKVMMIHPDMQGFVPASLGKRFGAFIIDYILMSFIAGAFVLFLGNLGFLDLAPFYEYLTLVEQTQGTLEDVMMDDKFEAVFTEIIKTVSIWGSVVFLLYFILQERFFGATIGKRLFRIRLVSFKSGKEISWRNTITKTMSFFLAAQLLLGIPYVGIFLFFLTIFWAFRDPLYQRNLYDIVAGTAVGTLPAEK